MSRPACDYQRTHVYAAVDYENPKYLFQVLGDKLEAALGGRPRPRLLDVGGASGALAGYLKHRFPDAQCCSLDFDKELCDIGRQRVPGVDFIQGDANHMDLFEDHSFDAVTMVGTMSVFDTFEPSLSECLRLAVPGGSVIVAGQFNDQPVDALIRYRYHGEVNWNSGYNLFSCKAVENFLDRHPDVTAYEFSPFELPFDLAPQQDSIRSWTERTADGRRELRNGLNLIINLKLLIIRTTGIMA
jgi:SAM-dependent methyltransferase